MSEIIYDSGLLIHIAVCNDILRVRVTTADNETLHYRGDITVRDNIEHGVTGTDGWQAKPGPFKQKLLNETYLMDITPTKPWHGYPPDRFTALSAVDRDMRHQIMHAILAVNPNLPYK